MSEQRISARQQQRQSVDEHQKPSLNPGQLLVTTGAALTSLGFDVATHGNVAYVLGGLVAVYAAGKLSPEILKYLVPGSDPQVAMEAVERLANHYAPEDSEDLPQDALSKVKRLLRIRSAEPGRPKEDHGDDEDLVRDGKRRLVAKQIEADASSLDGSVPPQFLLDEVLDWVVAFNAKDCIYFGRGKDGPIALPFDDMYHVFDMSSSGKGKSNRLRLAMMQIAKYCETYYINPLAAPVKAVKDDREVEVWQPIFDKLAGKHKAPVQDGEAIGSLLGTLVDEIDRRNERERRRDFSWEKKPIFVFIDELPETFRRCPEAKECMDTIGRMGRQYCIFMWVCSQNARVASTGLSLDALANFHTRIYGGGDARSRENIIGNVSREMDRALSSNGAGLTLMLADGMDASDFVRAPLVTNEAMFDYLELPSFILNDWLTELPEIEEADVLPLTTTKNAPESRNTLIKPSKYQSVKGPHYDAILDAAEALVAEEKPLTLNAIAVRARLNRNQYEEIENTVTYAGYDLVIGQGRPRGRE